MGLAMSKLEIKLPNFEKLQAQIKKVGNQKVKIGVLEGATYPNGTPVSKVAAYLEYGWTQTVTEKQRGWLAANGIYVKSSTVLNSPARPFFEATYTANRKKWVELAQNSMKGLTDDPNQALNKITQALTLIGLTAQQDLQDAIIDGGVGGSSFAVRSPMTMALYGNLLQSGNHRTDDTPNQTTRRKPLYKSGILEGSIAFEIVKE